MRFKLPNTIINFHVIKGMHWVEDILLTLKNHYQFVRVKDLENFYYGDFNLKNTCHITIDDGDRTVYQHLFPIIKKHQIPISIYVSPHSIKTGKNFWFEELRGCDLKLLLKFYNEYFNNNISYIHDKQVKALIKSLKINDINTLIDNFKKELNIPFLERRGMTNDEILELKESGLVEFGAHTQTHPILKNENDVVAKLEISNSIEELSDMLGFKVRYFAYPNGVPGWDFGVREINILKECGIKLAFSTENKRFSINDNPLSIPRNGITKGDKNFILAKLIFGNTWVQLRRILKGKQEFDYR